MLIYFKGPFLICSEEKCSITELSFLKVYLRFSIPQLLDPVLHVVKI